MAPVNASLEGAAERALREGLQDLSLSLSDEQVRCLIRYLALLIKWNRAYNLTALEDPADMVVRHLLDSLAVAPLLQGEKIIDVGTGPGLPGIPLAIALPDKAFTLLDSNGKKTRFLFQARVDLGLANVNEIKSRVENFRPEHLFDGVISRAFASLADMTAACRHLLAPGGRFYAMKGRRPEKELRELAKPFNVTASHRLAVPGLDGERHLIEIELSP